MAEDTPSMFERLARGGRRTIRRVPDPPEPEKSPDEILAGNLSQWALSAPKEFMEWLDGQCDRLNDETHRSITNHAAAAYAAGQEMTWRQLRRKFQEWKGEAAD